MPSPSRSTPSPQARLRDRIRTHGRRAVDLIAIGLAFAVVVALSLPATRPGSDAGTRASAAVTGVTPVVAKLPL